MTQHVFHKTTAGQVSYTALLKLLVIPDIRHAIRYLAEESFVGAPHLNEIAERRGGIGERNYSAWNVGYRVEQAVFEFFEKHPDRMKRFLECMDSLGSQGAYDIRYVAQGYDWSSLEKGTVVDIGGSLAHVSIAVSKVAPHLDFVVQDLENMVKDMNERVKTMAEPPERVTWAAQDFSQEQQIKDARVYLLGFILHRYSDLYTAKILRALIPAMGPQSRILVYDEVMPAPNTVAKHEGRKAR